MSYAVTIHYVLSNQHCVSKVNSKRVKELHQKNIQSEQSQSYFHSCDSVVVFFARVFCAIMVNSTIWSFSLAYKFKKWWGFGVWFCFVLFFY